MVTLSKYSTLFKLQIIKNDTYRSVLKNDTYRSVLKKTLCKNYDGTLCENGLRLNTRKKRKNECARQKQELLLTLS